MGPFIPFSEECINNGGEVDVISAATTKDELLFVEELEDLGCKMYIPVLMMVAVDLKALQQIVLMIY